MNQEKESKMDNGAVVTSRDAMGMGMRMRMGQTQSDSSQFLHGASDGGGGNLVNDNDNVND